MLEDYGWKKREGMPFAGDRTLWPQRGKHHKPGAAGGWLQKFRTAHHLRTGGSPTGFDNIYDGRCGLGIVHPSMGGVVMAGVLWGGGVGRPTHPLPSLGGGGHRP